MINRRLFLGGAAAVATGGSAVATTSPFSTSPDLRGSVDAVEHGMRPSAWDDQSHALQSLLDQAAKEDKPVFLPPGKYIVSNLRLPSRTRLMGIPGASRIVYGGHGFLFEAEGSEHLEMSGLVVDGANRTISGATDALLKVAACRKLVVDNCEFVGSAASALHLIRSAGRIERCRITGTAGTAAIYSVDANGLSIVNNEIAHCSNGGILVHRWKEGEDGTIVSGNRIEHIGAKNGGTGQWGNGINIFRAHSVTVANNRISDCAFSAVRSNGGNNIQILGNNCSRLGETALYSEFAFEGAMIANNIVDGATIGVSIANYMQGGRLAVCANNLIRNLKTKGPYPAQQPGFGIGISVEADTAVTGNVVEGAPLYGINLGWGPYLRNVAVSNNVIRRAGEGIAVTVVEGAGTATISNNIISEARNGAIVGHHWTKPVTKDLAHLSEHPYSHLILEKNVATS
ncbi:MAG: TIGR03808 family TAT-translocated repetitive protein [Pseudomonadota bacterium]